MKELFDTVQPAHVEFAERWSAIESGIVVIPYDGEEEDAAPPPP